MSTVATQFISYRALVGQVVARNRAVRQITQLTVATALGITQASLSRLETGQSSFSIEQMAVVAHVLKTTPNQLLAEADGLAAQLTRNGHKVVRTVLEADPDWSPLVGAALVGVLLGLVMAANR